MAALHQGFSGASTGYADKTLRRDVFVRAVGSEKREVSGAETEERCDHRRINFGLDFPTAGDRDSKSLGVARALD
jgi:hypothetical protein